MNSMPRPWSPSVDEPRHPLTLRTTAGFLTVRIRRDVVMKKCIAGLARNRFCVQPTEIQPIFFKSLSADPPCGPPRLSWMTTAQMARNTVAECSSKNSRFAVHLLSLIT